MKKIIEFENAKLGYGRKIIFRELDLCVCEGDFLSIVGPNGSGKTTLLRSMMGLLKPVSGKVIRDRSLRFGYCMQRQFVDTLFPFTVNEIVMMGRTGLIGYLKRPSVHDMSMCAAALKTSGIADLAGERFYDLSGGQKQRVLIARALALEPNFLILDEPTTDLDVKAEREILGLIKELHDKGGMTVALVSHEFNEFVNLAQKFMFLGARFHNRIFEVEDLTGELLSDIFGTKIILKEVDGHKLIM